MLTYDVLWMLGKWGPRPGCWWCWDVVKPVADSPDNLLSATAQTTCRLHAKSTPLAQSVTAGQVLSTAIWLRTGVSVQTELTNEHSLRSLACWPRVLHFATGCMALHEFVCVTSARPSCGSGPGASITVVPSILHGVANKVSVNIHGGEVDAASLITHRSSDVDSTLKNTANPDRNADSSRSHIQCQGGPRASSGHQERIVPHEGEK